MGFGNWDFGSGRLRVSGFSVWIRVGYWFKFGVLESRVWGLGLGLGWFRV